MHELRHYEVSILQHYVRQSQNFPTTISIGLKKYWVLSSSNLEHFSIWTLVQLHCDFFMSKLWCQPHFHIDTRYKLNVHKMFDLCPVSTGSANCWEKLLTSNSLEKTKTELKTYTTMNHNHVLLVLLQEIIQFST